MHDKRPIGEISERDAERFRSKTQAASGCHLWRGFRRKEKHGLGHGLFSMRSQNWLAHRIAYRLAYGVDPGDKVVRHTCDNKWCVAPQHLLLGSQADNVHDAFERGQLNTRGHLHPTHRIGKGVLNEDMVRDIRKRASLGEKQKDLAASFGVQKGLISRVVLKQRWSWVS